MQNLTKTYDTALLLKDAGVVAASAAAQVAGADKILDVGDAEVHGELQIDITAIEVASNDERYAVILQGSDSATFASGIENLAERNFGAVEVVGGSADSLVGRYRVPFTTNASGTLYRYLRIYTFIAGTIATGINYTAHLHKAG